MTENKKLLLKSPRVQDTKIFSPPLVSPPPTFYQKHVTIADTGCTGHYLMTNAPTTNSQPTTEGITVQLPDGSTMVSTHTAYLPLNLPPEACVAHLFPALTTASLISIGLLCDYGCEAHFNASHVTITDPHGNTVLTGTRSPSTRLWNVNLPSSLPGPTPHQSIPCSIPSPTPHTRPPPSVNAIFPTTNMRQRIAFLHAALFSPVISTLCNALDVGRLPTFPDLTSTLDRRYYPHSMPMIKGHLDQIR